MHRKSADWVALIGREQDYSRSEIFDFVNYLHLFHCTQVE